MTRTRKLLAGVCRERGDHQDAERHAAEAAALLASLRLPPRAEPEGDRPAT